MTSSLQTAYQNLSGIPITGPFAHPLEARESLVAMSMSYPGEIFNIEFTDREDAVVTWIPSQCINYWLGTALFNAATRGWTLDE